jgi:hypothetical protein
MNNAWAEQRVASYIEVLEAQRDIRNATPGASAQIAELEKRINEGLITILEISDRINPTFTDGLRKLDGGYSWRHKTQFQTCQILIGAIRDREELEANLADQGPKLAADGLHPWVWDHAKSLWADGHRRSAVQTAGTALFDAHVPAKLGKARDQTGGFNLMGAFSPKDPAPGSPRLRLTAYDRIADEQNWKSAHEGAMHLGQGCALYIRNLSTHDLREPDEQEALEMLAALSLVARLVDRAEVVTA